MKKPEWRPDKPTVIKDSEAIQYVGKEAELRGKVLSVTISPLGKAFVNFGREYPIKCSLGSLRSGLQLGGSAHYHDARKNHQHLVLRSITAHSRLVRNAVFKIVN